MYRTAGLRGTYGLSLPQFSSGTQTSEFVSLIVCLLLRSLILVLLLSELG